MAQDLSHLQCTDVRRFRNSPRGVPCSISSQLPDGTFPQSDLRRPRRDTVRSNSFNVAREIAADSRS
jgi:hypothetical protein